MKRIIYILCCIFLASCSDDENLMLEPVPQTQFVFEGMTIDIGESNGWATTRYNNRLALTNYDERTQYVLAWAGDSADGEKSDATLTISKEGQARQLLPLSYLTLQALNGTHYRLSFSDGNAQGEIVVEM